MKYEQRESTKSFAAQLAFASKDEIKKMLEFLDSELTDIAKLNRKKKVNFRKQCL